LEIPISLVEITEKVGKDINLVQGPGGNISYKNENFMLIKASGMKMSDVKQKNIFVKTNHRRIANEIENDNYDPTKTYTTNNDCINPSIETSMHALMPHKYVLHVHCVNTLSWIVQENYLEKIACLLKGENWGSVPYKKPGVFLAKEIKKEIKERKLDIILLSNHGLLVGANTSEKVYEITKRISEKLYVGQLKNNQVNFSEFDEYLLSKEYKLPKFNYVHNIAFSRFHYLIASQGDLFPDQIVFLKNGVSIIKNICDFKNIEKLSNNRRPVLLIPYKGILVPKNFKEVNENILLGLSMVISRIPNNASIKYLTKNDRYEILNWDLEKHRLKINS